MKNEQEELAQAMYDERVFASPSPHPKLGGKLDKIDTLSEEEVAALFGTPDRTARLDYAKRRFATTQFNLTGDARAKVLALADTIRESDLAEGGRESESHITIRYGLHGNDAAAVQQLVRDFGPVAVTLGETSIFAAHEADAQRGGDEFDVVKVEVRGERLTRLNKLLGQLEHTDTHPVYQPHVTLAYCKPGEGQKYVGKCDVEGVECHFTSFVFSDADGAETVISLVPE